MYEVHRRIADGYCAGAAITKFQTKYFCIKLCVESLSTHNFIQKYFV